MDPAGIELANAVAKCIVTPIAKLISEDAIVESADTLTKTFPVLGRMKALQFHQVKKSVDMLQRELRKVRLIVEGERALGFANMCYRYFEAGAKEHRELKLRMLAAACAHCGDQRNVDRYDEQIGFFDTVERLQPVHLQILQHLNVNYPRQADRKPSPARYDELFEYGFPLPEPNDFWLSQILADLHRENTIILWGGLGHAMSNDGRTLAVAHSIDSMIRNGDIFLHVYGHHLLGYVENALIAEE